MGRSKEEEEGEQTRFPCLALVRSLVAAGLTTLAVVVVVMVIVVLHRPEKIILTSSGYVQTQELWWDYGVDIVDGQIQNGRVRSNDYRVVPVEDIAQTQNGRVRSNHTVVQVQEIAPSGPAKWVMFLVIVFAYNPSGRGEVNCTVTSISIIDMPNEPFFTDITGTSLIISKEDMVEITRLPSLVNFTLPPQTWHRHRSSVKITGKPTLKYLYDNHADEFRFKVMVQVNMTQHSGNKRIDASYYCWPVLVVYGAPADIPADSEVHCKTGEEMDFSTKWPVQVPVPAPAPAP